MLTKVKIDGRLALLLAAVSTVALLHATRAWQSAVSEDAYILFRYAEHLANGDGLVWNVGEAPIEGFTSLLHVLVLAVGSLAGGERVVAFSQLVGIVSAVLTCWTAAWLALEVSRGDRRAAVLTAFGVAIASPIAVWARGGLETVTFTALLALAMAAWLHDSRRGSSRLASSLAFFVATLSRPEALGIAGLSALFDFARPPRADLAARLRRLVPWWPYAALIAAYVAWKLTYFGDVLPNTYYAKTGGGLWAARVGVGYILWFGREYWVLAWLLLAALPLVSKRKPGLEFAYATACVASYVVPILLSGGGRHYAFRYLVPVLPPLLTLAAAGATTGWDAVRSRSAPPRWTLAATAAILVAWPLSTPTLHQLTTQPHLLLRPLRLVDHDAVEGSHYVQLGRALHEIVPPGQKIGSIAVGAIGYHSKRPILDLLGLNDRAIARTPIELDRHHVWRAGHMKGSAAEVLRQRPEYLLLQATPPTDEPDQPPSADTRTYYPFVDDLLRSPEFHAQYRLDSHQLDDGRWLNVYRRM